LSDGRKKKYIEMFGSFTEPFNCVQKFEVIEQSLYVSRLTWNFYRVFTSPNGMLWKPVHCYVQRFCFSDHPNVKLQVYVMRLTVVF